MTRNSLLRGTERRCRRTTTSSIFQKKKSTFQKNLSYQMVWRPHAERETHMSMLFLNNSFLDLLDREDVGEDVRGESVKEEFRSDARDNVRVILNMRGHVDVKCIMHSLTTH